MPQRIVRWGVIKTQHLSSFVTVSNIDDSAVAIVFDVEMPVASSIGFVSAENVYIC